MGAIYNIKVSGCKVADSFYTGNHADQVTNIEGLLGTDAPCLMKHFRTVSCVKGNALDTCHGFVPFGSIDAFLTPSQKLMIFGERSPPRQDEQRKSS